MMFFLVIKNHYHASLSGISFEGPSISSTCLASRNHTFSGESIFFIDASKMTNFRKRVDLWSNGRTKNEYVNVTKTFLATNFVLKAAQKEDSMVRNHKRFSSLKNAIKTKNRLREGKKFRFVSLSKKIG